jgi:formylglycine-generating enzyme required for sulfatase activity
MKSQVWMLLVSFLLVCGTICCGQKPEPIAQEPKPVVEEPKAAVEEPDTAVSKPDVTEEAGSSGEIVNSVGMKLKLIPAGEFLMGSPESDKSAIPNEKPQHKVRITKPFYLGVTEVTQEQYEKVMGKNPSNFKGPANPVENMSWDDAVEFCKRLSAKEGKTYRLPTEAEWEYACRAGTTTEYSFGDDAASLGEYAWFVGNSERETHPVGQKKPNAWGLRDMHGNANEWCQDWYGEYSSDAVTDPPGDDGGSFRVGRGGSWSLPARLCRSAYRYGRAPGFRLYVLGFRVARSLSSE